MTCERHGTRGRCCADTARAGQRSQGGQALLGQSRGHRGLDDAVRGVPSSRLAPSLAPPLPTAAGAAKADGRKMYLMAGTCTSAPWSMSVAETSSVR
mmetsp:Transcript_24838/g.57489  ORF Transcript_24838/g.57489 Transcript_24838/m.57489 type:complete len:97 (-) Transcript_24838:32-322(-)